MNINDIEIIGGVTGKSLSVPLDPQKDYDIIAERIIRNDCPYFLAPIKKVSIDGLSYYRYDLGNYQPIESMYRSMMRADFILLMKNIIKPFSECGDWMIDSRSFVLDEQMIFISNYERQVRYIYSFEKDYKNSDKQISDFFSAIIKKMYSHITDGGSLREELLAMIVEDRVTVPSLYEIIKKYDTPVKNNAPVVSRPVVEKPVEQEPVKAQPAPAPKPFAALAKEKPAPAPAPTPAPAATNENNEPEAALSEEDKIREALFGGKPAKSAPKNNDKKKKSSFNPFDLLQKKKGAAAPAAPSAAVSVASPITADEGNDETVFVGGDETEFFGAGPHFMLRSKSGNLPAPERIDISLNNNSEMTIGRRSDGNSSADYLFSSDFKKISRKHCMISYDNGSYYITDLGSANKTLLNGTALTPNKEMLLEDGATVVFGDNSYVYEYSSH